MKIQVTYKFHNRSNNRNKVVKSFIIQSALDLPSQIEKAKAELSSKWKTVSSNIHASKLFEAKV